MPRARPYPKLSPAFGQGIREDDRPLFGQPQRSLSRVPGVESDEAAGQTTVRTNRLQIGLGDVVAVEQSGAEASCTIAADEDVDVPDVVRAEDSCQIRPALVEPLPEAPAGGWWCQPVDDHA